MRRGNLVSVKARLEIKAIDRTTDKILATDRQTAVIMARQQAEQVGEVLALRVAWYLASS